MSSTALALLVAFFAVLTSLIQAASAIWPEQRSDLAFLEPVFYGTSAHVIVTNSGDQTGSLEDAFLSSSFIDGDLKFDPITPSERMVPPGSQQIMFATNLGVSLAQAKEILSTLEESTNSPSGGDPAGQLAFAVRHSDGSLEEVVVDVSHYELFKLFYAHVERCTFGPLDRQLLAQCDLTGAQPP